MARNNHTPVPFWLSQPLGELGRWVKANNRLIEKDGQRRQENRPTSGRGRGN